MYCQNMVNIQTPFLAANQTLLATGQSPVTAVGNNLFTFLANRLSMSFTNLGCQNFGLTNPVTVTLDGAGVPPRPPSTPRRRRQPTRVRRPRRRRTAETGTGMGTGTGAAADTGTAVITTS